MAPKLRLRRFLYLNESLTDEFLAQLEGGLYSEESQTVTDTKERGGSLGGRVGPLEGKASKGSAGEETTERTIRQVAEGAFTRLAEHLEEQGALQPLDAFDEDIWDQ